MGIIFFILGGTDIVDQRSDQNTTGSKTKRWSVKFFRWELDVTRINAQTIYSLNKKLDPRKTDSFTFGWQLGMSLVVSHMERRRGLPGLQKHITVNMDSLLRFVGRTESDAEERMDNRDEQGELAEPLPGGSQTETRPKDAAKCWDLCTNPRTPGGKGHRCELCYKGTAGDGHKTLKNALSKQSTQCQLCCIPVCKEHSTQICKDCASTFVKEKTLDMNMNL